MTSRALALIGATLALSSCVGQESQLKNAATPTPEPWGSVAAPRLEPGSVAEAFRDRMRRWYDGYQTALLPVVSAFNAVSTGGPAPLARGLCNDLLVSAYDAKGHVGKAADEDVAHSVEQMFKTLDWMAHGCLQEKDGTTMTGAIVVHGAAHLIDHLTLERYGKAGVAGLFILPADAVTRGAAASSEGDSQTASPDASAAVGNSAPSQHLETPVVVDAHARVTESNSVWWRFAWQAVLYNPNSVGITFHLKVDFNDEEKFTIDTDDEYRLELGPGQRMMFTGTKLVDMPGATRVAGIHAWVPR